MRKTGYRLFFVLVAVTGLFLSPVFADLGLAQLAAGPQGAPAVGQAVLTAAKAVYANNTDPAIIQQQLIAILNEAAATGNEPAVRYAIVAVMMAGGGDNLALSKAAIDGSNVFANYPSLTAVTVTAVEALLKAGGGAGDAAGGGDQLGGGDDKEKGGGDELGGGDPRSLGGGNDNPFLLELGVDPDNPFTWGSLTGGGDNDLPATRT
jgi:hypothetical protein